MQLYKHHLSQIHSESIMSKNAPVFAPRQCSATHRLIPTKDHAAVSLAIGHVDSNGVYTGESTLFALSGYVRAYGEADQAVNRLASADGLMKPLSSFAGQHKFKRHAKKH